MRKIIISLLIGLALMIVPSMATTGHINGCTNTGAWNNCCTKTFNITAKPGYRIVDVIVNGVSKGVITSYTFGNLTSAQILKVVTEAIPQTTPANAPVIITGLTPVNWNGTAWESTTVANWDYNYNSVATATHNTVAGNGDGKWANAQTADGSLYVWIPRYTYKITSGEHQSGNSWNSLDNPGTNKIEIKFSNGIIDDTSSGYIKHSAFTFGEDELKGIWVAKYEASKDSTTSVAKSIPSATSWIVNGSVGDAFNYAYNTYRNADSHLIKNTEWGAVAYLTNAIGRIPYVNNYSKRAGNTFIAQTGYSGNSQDAPSITSGAYAWNTETGVKASTTHNVYGIYDMSGGASEYVAAYSVIEDSNAYIRELRYAQDKYVDRYGASTKKGDALSETTSWDGDIDDSSSTAIQAFCRGGRYSGEAESGIFAVTRDGGNVSRGFRVVLGIK